MLGLVWTRLVCQLVCLCSDWMDVAHLKKIKWRRSSESRLPQQTKPIYKWVLWLSKVAEKKLPGNQCTIYLTYINIYLIWSLYVLDLKRVVLYFKIFHQVLFILTKNQDKGISINRFITTFHVISGGCGFP